ncbi:InlB B-repeat-containing protein [Bifidobacterium sp. ESL0745]|uniref:InlB B-repeat-containing protein n=1 Tax=Bifidobacterium sp. ESL0745 TaxID=2983226 RepID=UPI0023F7ABE1|nr:InlB B-repeat-containing protein [Bifidobacterium sp. ESL0745]MDF7665616.1 InlB B-repeat-containing protein [Bifidobacterium sp. ESL0745]
MWYGRASIVEFNLNGATSGNTPVKLAGPWPDKPTIALPSLSGIGKTGYRAAGWDESASAVSPTYRSGEAYTPTSSLTLYAVWQRLEKPQYDAGLVTPGMGGGSVGVVKISGSVPIGAGKPVLATGDSLDVRLMPQNDQASIADNAGTAATLTSFDKGTGKWAATVPVSVLAAADTVGKGASYMFRARLTTVSDGDSDYSFSSPVMADVVAPAFKANSLKFDQRVRTVSGNALSSGDTGVQTARTGETYFTVRVTWPSGSSTTSTTLTCVDGVASGTAASVPGTTCPASGATDGAFTLGIPQGVMLKNNASLTVEDHPNTDVPTLTGKGTPNVSLASTLDITAETVSSLPMTGYTKPWWTQTWFYALFAAAGVAVVNIVLRRRSLSGTNVLSC